MAAECRYPILSDYFRGLLVEIGELWDEARSDIAAYFGRDASTEAGEPDGDPEQPDEQADSTHAELPALRAADYERMCRAWRYIEPLLVTQRMSYSAIAKKIKANVPGLRAANRDSVAKIASYGRRGLLG
jgi:hypothetical protein